jgi:hypothetical protein
LDVNDYLPNTGLPSVLIDPNDLSGTGLTVEDLEGLRRYQETGVNPVVDLFNAGVITNANDQ